MTKGQVGRG